MFSLCDDSINTVVIGQCTIIYIITINSNNCVGGWCINKSYQCILYIYVYVVDICIAKECLFTQIFFFTSEITFYLFVCSSFFLIPFLHPIYHFHLTFTHSSGIKSNFLYLYFIFFHLVPLPLLDIDQLYIPQLFSFSTILSLFFFPIYFLYIILRIRILYIHIRFDIYGIQCQGQQII